MDRRSSISTMCSESDEITAKDYNGLIRELMEEVDALQGRFYGGFYVQPWNEGDGASLMRQFNTNMHPEPTFTDAMVAGHVGQFEHENAFPQNPGYIDSGYIDSGYIDSGYNDESNVSIGSFRGFR